MIPPTPSLTVEENANFAVVEGTLTQPADWRVTPGGVPVARMELEHLSTPQELAPLNRLELRIPVLAMGDLAERCRTYPPGARLRAEGRLNQKRWIRDGKTRWGAVELVARSVLLLTLPADDDTNNSLAKD